MGRSVAVLGSLTALLGSLFVATALPTAAGAEYNWAPLHTGDFPDPSILLYGSTYYGYATQSFAAPESTINIQVSTSSDGVHWTQLGTDALPNANLGAWAKPGNTWAPSVAFNGTKFVMYYTATETSTGDQCIGVAVSATALGPFVDDSTAPAVCDNDVDASPTVDMGPMGGSIDPQIFYDPVSKTSSLIWKSDANHLTPPIPTTIWSIGLSTNLLTTTGSATPLLTSHQAWQSGIVEGPFMDYQPPASGTGPGNYYLFYSGSYEGASTYAIGWADCPSGPAASCNDATSPLLTSQPGMSGPGGPDVFTVGSQSIMAFAAWQGTTIGYLTCGLRPMYEAVLSFQPNGASAPTPTLASITTSPASSPSCPVPPAPPQGYWQVASDGGIFSFGAAQFYGSTGSLKLNRPVVGLAPTPDRHGYWLVASDGGIFAFGDAQFYGSTGNVRLNQPIIGMIPTFDGNGYWLVASDGGIFAFGDAQFYGSTGGQQLAYPITAAAPGYLGGGYWLVDSNGQVFPFGDAKFEGEPSFAPGGYRITGMAATQNDNGYWLASANGNVANFGNAAPYGSMIGATLNAPVVGMSATRTAAGYWLQGADGGIFCFGDAMFFGSMGGKHLNAPMVAIATA